MAAVLATIEKVRGRLDVLVNDIFGGDRYAEWNARTAKGSRTSADRETAHQAGDTVASCIHIARPR